MSDKPKQGKDKYSINKEASEANRGGARQLLSKMNANTEVWVYKLLK